MQWVKRIKKFISFEIIFVFALLFLLTRLPFLNKDVINPDGVNWHFRSEQFVVALKARDFERTYQHYHPGVTLMWIMGPTVEIIKQLSSVDKVYTHYNFLTFHFYSKLVLMTVQLVLSIISIHLLDKLLGMRKAFLIVTLFSLEPFFLGNSRLLHLDVLLTLFIFNGLLSYYISLMKFDWRYLVLSGFFLALGFLTKSVGVLALIYILAVGLFSVFYVKRGGFLRQKPKVSKQIVIYVLVPFLIFASATFVLFPALWVSPIEVLVKIFDEAERVGIRKGHGQVILGEYTRDAGVLFYPLILLMKVTPFTVIGVFLLSTVCMRTFIREKTVKKGKTILFLYYLTGFYFGYLILMMYPSKKIDRYMIPIYPYLALLAVVGYYEFNKRFSFFTRIRFKFGVLVLFLVSVIWPLLTFYPYYFTYTSPVFGNAEDAHKIIAQKPFGIGIPELKGIIFERYGLYPKLGFIDVKPMRSIYMNSKIYDIRVNGTSDYDILILGPNEEMPKKVLDSDTKFLHDYSMYINGLEYWKIYAKEGFVSE